MSVLQKIQIPRRHTHCAKENEVFTSGMHYHSTLIESEEEGYQRKDYCLECWNSMEEHEGINWASQVPQNKGPDLRDLNRDQKALELLKFAQEEDNHKEAFILALYLVRKKKMQFREEMVHEDGETYSLYEVLATEEMIPVKKIALDDLPVLEVQAEIASKLQGVQESNA